MPAPPTRASNPGPRRGSGSRRFRLTRRRLTLASLVLSCAAAVLFALAVHHAVSDSQDALATVGRDDTAGIRAAQRVKSDLAEMDLIVTTELLRPTAAKGELPTKYNDIQKELIADLDAASAHITLGTAETVPLANLQYERAQYHSVVRDAIFADQRGDRTEALNQLNQAHQVMAGSLGLLDQADAFDKANTYALNQSYQAHQTSSSSSNETLATATVALLIVLVVVQLFLVAGFHRVLNVGMALTTVVATLMVVFAGARISSSHQSLTDAREKAFDPVHELWQARASAFEARQAEAQGLLESGVGEDPGMRFDAAIAKLYRLPTGTAKLAENARLAAAPVGSGGALAHQLTGSSLSTEASAAARNSLARLADYLDAHATLLSAEGQSTHPTTLAPSTIDSFTGTGDQDNGHAFDRLISSIDATLAIDEKVYDAKAQDAQDALNGIDAANIVCLVAMLGLVAWGLQQRLREYGGA